MRWTINKKQMAATLLVAAVVLLFPPGLLADDKATIDRVIAGVEARYSRPGFTADFHQESILKAMGVTDTATGRLLVRQPGRMRWAYDTPEPQTIITDGDQLWVHRPQENQVLVGKAPALFGEGKGAGFLSDIKMVRRSFAITLAPSPADDLYRLHLVPNRSTVDLRDLTLDISKKTYDLVTITTFNVYGDETRIRLSRIDFAKPPAEALFRFQVPEGADVLEMNP